MDIACPRCGTVTESPAVGEPVCSQCGLGAAASQGGGPPSPPPGAKVPQTGYQPGYTQSGRPGPSYQPSYGQGSVRAAKSDYRSSYGQNAGHTGQSLYQASYQSASTQTNGKGVAALVLGIVGLLGAGPLTGIPAILLGSMARKEIRAGEGGGDAVALAGLILGWIATVVGLLTIVLAAVVFVLVSDVAGPDPASVRVLAGFR